MGPARPRCLAPSTTVRLAPPGSVTAEGTGGFTRGRHSHRPRRRWWRRGQNAAVGRRRVTIDSSRREGGTGGGGHGLRRRRSGGDDDRSRSIGLGRTGGGSRTDDGRWACGLACEERRGENSGDGEAGAKDQHPGDDTQVDAPLARRRRGWRGGRDSHRRQPGPAQSGVPVEPGLEHLGLGGRRRARGGLRAGGTRTAQHPLSQGFLDLPPGVVLEIRRDPEPRQIAAF